jgi:hypothetical protein
MKRLFLLSFLCAACTGPYTTITPRDPIFTDKRQNLDPLEEDGEKYTRRGDLTTDTSRFPPTPNETYDSYRDRIFTTLLAQELEIERLKTGIEDKTGSILNLSAQLEPMQEQQGEMRLALSQPQNSEGFATNKGASKHRLFQRYLVQKGDTLQKISHEHYGTYTGWIALYRFNHQRLPFGPNRIDEGTTLLVPNISALAASPTSN